MEQKLSSMRHDVIQEFVALYQIVGHYQPIEPYLRENEGGSVFFENAVSHNRDFLEAKSSARRCLEVEQRIRWEEIPMSKASLKKDEHEHALDLFKLEYFRRKLGKKSGVAH
ncbi:hypothetical protein ZWY2020_054629 [Hordeum vulgare]|nr:hypothetical protein ZWY2020_054629 [Hordeum vulgare]